MGSQRGATTAPPYTNGLVYSANGMTQNDTPITVSAEITDLTHGARQGGISSFLNRAATMPMSASDENPDCAIKAKVTNRSASESYARLRGMDLGCESRDTGAGAYFLEGAYIYVKNRSGTTMNNSGYMYAIKAETNHNSTGTCEVAGINIHDITQSSTASALYGIKVTTGAYAITRTSVMQISSAAGSWTNILHLADADHTNFIYAAGEGGCIGATKTSPSNTATCDGSIVVLIGSKSLKIPLYNAVTIT